MNVRIRLRRANAAASEMGTDSCRRRPRRARRASRTGPRGARACGTRGSRAGSSARRARNTPSATLAAAGERGDAADDRGAEHRRRGGPRPRWWRSRVPNRDRIRVGDERAVHRDTCSTSRRRRRSARENSPNAFAARPHTNTNTEKHGGRPADDRRAAEPVGEPSHRQRAEREEGTDRRGDEDDDTVAHAERVADVRRQHRQGRRFELGEALQQREDHEREHTAARDAFAQGDRVVADARAGARRGTATSRAASACSVRRSASASSTACTRPAVPAPSDSDSSLDTCDSPLEGVRLGKRYVSLRACALWKRPRSLRQRTARTGTLE